MRGGVWFKNFKSVDAAMVEQKVSCQRACVVLYATCRTRHTLTMSRGLWYVTHEAELQL